MQGSHLFFIQLKAASVAELKKVTVWDETSDWIAELLEGGGAAAGSTRTASRSLGPDIFQVGQQRLRAQAGLCPNCGDARGESLAGTQAPARVDLESAPSGDAEGDRSRTFRPRPKPGHGPAGRRHRKGRGGSARGPPVFKYAQASWGLALREASGGRRPAAGWRCERQVGDHPRTPSHCPLSARGQAWGRRCERCESSSSSWWTRTPRPSPRRGPTRSRRHRRHGAQCGPRPSLGLGGSRIPGGGRMRGQVYSGADPRHGTRRVDLNAPGTGRK